MPVTMPMPSMYVGELKGKEEDKCVAHDVVVVVRIAHSGIDSQTVSLSVEEASFVLA